jgi:hypothetical protein
MIVNIRAAAAASVLLITISTGGTAFAQKSGGILRTYDSDSPGACRSWRRRQSPPEAR